MNLDSAKKTFFLESRENLARIEQNLLTLHENVHDLDFVNALFREVHTIKGSAGMFGFNTLSNFAHDFESLLDELRNGAIEATDELIEISLDAHDLMKMLVDLAENETEPNMEILEQSESVSDRIVSLLDTKQADEETKEESSESEGSTPTNIDDDQDSVDEEATPHSEETDLDERKDSEERVKSKCWHISLTLAPDVYISGIDPYSFLSYLKKIGRVACIRTLFENMPDFDSYIPEHCYFAFEIDLEADSTVSRGDILQVFEFLSEDCKVSLLEPNALLSEYSLLIEESHHEKEFYIEELVSMGTLLEEEARQLLEGVPSIKKEETSETTHEISQEEAEKTPQTASEVEVETAPQAVGEEKSSTTVKKQQRSIRVDADKIDNLIALVGELVISGANIRQRTTNSEDTELLEAIAFMTRLVDDIRDATMNVRMVPIGETFTTYRRTVHDLAKQLGKKAELKIQGGDTELDKTLVEKISEPLMHLVRNAVDHGIEKPEERERAGKDPVANVELNAYHESGSVVIEIADDGAGLSRDKIRQKAIQVGLISENEDVEDRTLWNLITEPGFSTASEVTDVSGRGVGMDVVRKNIEKLRGLLDITSTPGKGARFSIHLPLTLAIIDGFLVTVNNNKYVFPLDMVLECTDMTIKSSDSASGNFLTLRNEVLPYLHLRELFFGSRNNDAEGKQSKERVVIVEYARRRAGIVVDQLLGEFQTVIKPLGRIFNNMKFVSGATILGKGDVALIIDVPRLIEHVREQNKQG